MKIVNKHEDKFNPHDWQKSDILHFVQQIWLFEFGLKIR